LGLSEPKKRCIVHDIVRYAASQFALRLHDDTYMKRRKEVKKVAEEKFSCVKPAKGPTIAESVDTMAVTSAATKEVLKMLAKVGKPAPDFEANAFVNGTFSSVKLSDYKGQWISLCFYPGDFTFV